MAQCRDDGETGDGVGAGPRILPACRGDPVLVADRDSDEIARRLDDQRRTALGVFEDVLDEHRRHGARGQRHVGASPLGEPPRQNLSHHLQAVRAGVEFDVGASARPRRRRNAARGRGAVGVQPHVTGDPAAGDRRAPGRLVAHQQDRYVRPSAHMPVGAGDRLPRALRRHLEPADVDDDRIRLLQGRLDDAVAHLVVRRTVQCPGDRQRGAATGPRRRRDLHRAAALHHRLRRYPRVPGVNRAGPIRAANHLRQRANSRVCSGFAGVRCGLIWSGRPRGPYEACSGG